MLLLLLLLYLYHDYYIYYLCFLWWLWFTHPSCLKMLPRIVGNLQVIMNSAGSLEVCFRVRLFDFRRIKGSLALKCHIRVGIDCFANVACFDVMRFLCISFCRLAIFWSCEVLNDEVWWFYFEIWTTLCGIEIFL